MANPIAYSTVYSITAGAPPEEFAPEVAVNYQVVNPDGSFGPGRNGASDILAGLIVPFAYGDSDESIHRAINAAVVADAQAQDPSLTVVEVHSEV
jgi:hypothetical protein